MMTNPVVVDPVIVTAVVVNDVTTDAAGPFVVNTTGVRTKAVGKVYDAVPFNAFNHATTFLYDDPWCGIE